VLFRRAALDGIAAGEITVAFRRWRRPTVKAGGTLRSRAGMLAIDSVDPIGVTRITRADARRAGFEDADAVRASLAPEGQLYRIVFHLAGPDPRIALRERGDLSPDERADLERRLAAMDQRSARGPWTAATLKAIAENPGKRAVDLAEDFGMAKLPFKTDVRKLKELGLTESLEVGYRLSPRGEAFRSGSAQVGE
jgi:hypothetical protein